MGVTQGLHDHSDGAEKVFWEKSGIRRGLGVVVLLRGVLGVLLLVTWAAAANGGGEFWKTVVGIRGGYAVPFYKARAVL